MRSPTPARAAWPGTAPMPVPRGAIHFEHGQAQIDQTKCIKCGKCKAACSYQAIIKFFRPCQEACGMDAIGKDDHGRAQINHHKCVNCGMCLVNCPLRRHCGQGPAVPADPRHPGRSKGHRHHRPGLLGPVRRKGHSRPDQGRHEGAGLCGPGGGGRGCGPVRHRGSGRVFAGGAGEAALYGHVLLPGLVRDGQEGVPGLCTVYLHDHDAHGADGPAPEAPEPRLQDRLHRALRRQEAGSQPPQRPQRCGLRPDL